MRLLCCQLTVLRGFIVGTCTAEKNVGTALLKKIAEVSVEKQPVVGVCTICLSMHKDGQTDGQLD